MENFPWEEKQRLLSGWEWGTSYRFWPWRWSPGDLARKIRIHKSENVSHQHY